jgi:hypothetical protein
LVVVAQGLLEARMTEPKDQVQSLTQLPLQAVVSVVGRTTETAGLVVLVVVLVMELQQAAREPLGRAITAVIVEPL